MIFRTSLSCLAPLKITVKYRMKIMANQTICFLFLMAPSCFVIIPPPWPWQFLLLPYQMQIICQKNYAWYDTYPKQIVFTIQVNCPQMQFILYIMCMLLTCRIHSCLSEFTGFDLAALNAVLIMAVIAVNRAIKNVMKKISTPIEILSE